MSATLSTSMSATTMSSRRFVRSWRRWQNANPKVLWTYLQTNGLTGVGARDACAIVHLKIGENDHTKVACIYYRWQWGCLRYHQQTLQVFIIILLSLYWSSQYRSWYSWSSGPCNIISVQYKLDFHVDPSGLSFDLVVSLPITVSLTFYSLHVTPFTS